MATNPQLSTSCELCLFYQDYCRDYVPTTHALQRVDLLVEPTDGRGLRFVAWAASPACVQELCAVARKHGHQPHGTDHFLTESNPQ